MGFVALSALPEPATATITHVGVLARHRGHGHRLVAAGTMLGAHAGYTAMINEVGVDNTPMAKAFLDAGHRDKVRPWHMWHYCTITH